MDLKQFVSLALQQMVDGVADAQKTVKCGIVNPTISMPHCEHAAKMKILVLSNGIGIHMVEFDVAVTVAETSGSQGGFGLVVGPVAIGSKGQTSTESSTVSHIKFQVPIAWPEEIKRK